MNITERLQLIVNEKFGGNKASFARCIGIAPTSISNYLSKERSSKPSSDLLENIVNNIPDINAKWLLTGNGDAFDNNNSIDYSSIDDLNNQSTPPDNTFYMNCIKNLTESNKKNAEANILNAEANNRNSLNLERLIQMLIKNGK